MKANTLTESNSTLSSTIDAIVTADFNGLRDFLSVLKNRTRRRGAGLNPRIENKTLDYVIQAFITSADAYFNGGLALIKPEADVSKKAKDYAKIFDNLVEHAHVLADIARPHLDGRFEEPLSPSFERLSNMRVVFEKLIMMIGKRIACPTILPVYSEYFKYIHFHYVDGVAAIGIPPHIFASPFWNLGILWHEAAGYKVAQAKCAGKLNQWTQEIPDHSWESCRDLYKKSFKKKQAVRADASDQEIEDFLKTDMHWREFWLGEFFEDLFGVQMLGGPMVTMLTHILIRNYDDMAIGDAKHPSPLLRIETVLNYLMHHVSHQDFENIRTWMADDINLYSLPKEQREFANEVVNCYCRHAQEFFGTLKLTDEETIVRNAIEDAYDSYFTQRQHLNDILKTLWTTLAGISTTPISPRQSPLWRREDEISIFFRQSADHHGDIETRVKELISEAKGKRNDVKVIITDDIRTPLQDDDINNVPAFLALAITETDRAYPSSTTPPPPW